ncbi:MAG: hypothetical protein AAFZ74_05570 [Pseudomonadota bacterium]
MASELIKGQKTFRLSEGTDRFSLTMQNDTDQDCHDLILLVNDTSWDTPEFTKIRVHKMKPSGSEIDVEDISVVGGDLTSREHPKWSRKNRIKPGEKFQVKFDLNDELGEDAFVTISPTDAGGRVIVGGEDKPPKIDTALDRLLELINIISKIKGLVSSLGLISSKSDGPADEAAELLLGMILKSDDIEMSKKTLSELAMIDVEVAALSRRLATVLAEASPVKALEGRET